MKHLERSLNAREDESGFWVSSTNAHPNDFANGLAAAPGEVLLVREGFVSPPRSGLR